MNSKNLWRRVLGSVLTLSDPVVAIFCLLRGHEHVQYQCSRGSRHFARWNHSAGIVDRAVDGESLHANYPHRYIPVRLGGRRTIIQRYRLGEGYFGRVAYASDPSSVPLRVLSFISTASAMATQRSLDGLSSIVGGWQALSNCALTGCRTLWFVRVRVYSQPHAQSA